MVIIRFNDPPVCGRGCSVQMMRFSLTPIFLVFLSLLSTIGPSQGGDFNLKVDQYIVKNMTISDGKIRQSQSIEYFLTTLDHPMTASEEKRYMEGEIHQLFHNQERGWVYLLKQRGGEQKVTPVARLNHPLLLDLQKKLTPLLGEFPQRFIIVFYSPEFRALRIRFHPQKNEELGFYQQMMNLLNSKL